MLDFNEHRDSFKKLFPTYTEEELEYTFEVWVDFWKWMVENFDIFFDVDKLRDEWYIK